MSAPREKPFAESERAVADLRFCGEQFESIRSDLRDLTASLGAEQLGWEPNDLTWSIAQCIEHLSNATEVDLRRLAAMIALAGVTLRWSRGPLRIRSSARAIVLHDAGRQASPAIAATRAATLPPVVDASMAVGRFLDLNERMLVLIDRAGQLAPRMVAGRTGALLLELVGHALQLSALHHWRFLLQARRVMERPGFPRH